MIRVGDGRAGSSSKSWATSVSSSMASSNPAQPPIVSVSNKVRQTKAICRTKEHAGFNRVDHSLVFSDPCVPIGFIRTIYLQLHCTVIRASRMSAGFVCSGQLMPRYAFLPAGFIHTIASSTARRPPGTGLQVGVGSQFLSHRCSGAVATEERDGRIEDGTEPLQSLGHLVPVAAQ